MYDTVRIQVQYLTSAGFPISDWQDMTFLNNPTQRNIWNQMIVAKQAWPRARVRAVDKQGRMIDMLAA